MILKKLVDRLKLLVQHPLDLHRLFNIVVASLGLLFFAPLFGVVALALLVQDRGQIFVRNRKVGKDGVLFDLFQFRVTSRYARPSAGEEELTLIGRFLRRSVIEELPMLINVVLGDMNFVGPRPQDPLYIHLYEHEYEPILQYRPGMTSPGSLLFRNEREILRRKNLFRVYNQEILPRKLALEMEYFQEQSIGGDMRLIFQTFVSAIVSNVH